MPEVRLGHTGRHDEAVVGILDGHTLGHGCMDDSPLEVEATDLSQLDADILLSTDDVSECRCDLPRGEHPRRCLVEKWLEEMVIAPVDEA